MPLWPHQLHMVALFHLIESNILVRISPGHGAAQGQWKQAYLSFSRPHHFPPAREKQLHFRKDQTLLSSNFTADNVILRCLPGQLNSSVILQPICYWQQCSTYWMQIYHLLLARTWFFSPLGALTRRNSLWFSPPLWDPPNANKPVA